MKSGLEGSIAASEHLRRSYLAEDTKNLEEHAKEKGPIPPLLGTKNGQRWTLLPLCNARNEPSRGLGRRQRRWEKLMHEGTNS